MKEELYNDTLEEKEEQPDVKAILFKYIIAGLGSLHQSLSAWHVHGFT